MSFSYEPYSDGIRLTEYQGEETELIIPEKIDGKAVRALGSGMFFSYRNEVRTILVPGCVKVIQSNALEGCQYLNKLVLEEGIEVLERNFAEMTDLETLNIPASVRKFDHPMDCSFSLTFSENGFYFTDGKGIYRKNENHSFSFCGFLFHVHPEDYSVLEGTIEILADAFHNQESLKHVFLPSSIKKIEEGALCTSALDFQKHKALCNISINNNGALFIQDHFLCIQKEKGTELILYLDEKKLFKIPDINEISTYAFCNQNIERISIPASVTIIHPDAFYGCPLTCIHFDASNSDLFFPLRHLTLREELLAGFGRNHQAFDYAYYDEKICQKFLSAERVRLMVQRLYAPEGLSVEKKNQFIQILSSKIEEAVGLAAEREDDNSVLHMQQLHLINAENLDSVIQILTRMNRTALTAQLLYNAGKEKSMNDLFL